MPNQTRPIYSTHDGIQVIVGTEVVPDYEPVYGVPYDGPSVVNVRESDDRGSTADDVARDFPAGTDISASGPEPVDITGASDDSADRAVTSNEQGQSTDQLPPPDAAA